MKLIQFNLNQAQQQKQGQANKPIAHRMIPSQYHNYLGTSTSNPNPNPNNSSSNNNSNSNISNSTSTSFGLIWYYWYKKYMMRKSKKYSQGTPMVPTQIQQQINQLKLKYRIQAIQTQNINIIRKRIQQLRQKNKLQSSASSTITNNTNNTSNTANNLQLSSMSMDTNLNINVNVNANVNGYQLTMPPYYYTINPQKQSKEIEYVLMGGQPCDQPTDPNANTNVNGNRMVRSRQQYQQQGEMVAQLRSYYLNSNTIYLIYRQQTQISTKQKPTKTNIFPITIPKNIHHASHNHSNNHSLINDHDNDHDNMRTQNQCYLGMSARMISSGLHQDDSGVDRAQSVYSCDRIQQLDGLEILHSVVMLDGIQLWACVYYNIPHSYIKITKNSWSRCMNLPICHPCSPKTIPNLPLCPRVHALRPSIDKVPMFVSFIQLLWVHNPLLCPVRQSILQYNGLPYILVQEGKMEDIGMLCYYVAYGVGDVDRWLIYNPDCQLARIVKYMRELQKSYLPEDPSHHKDNKDCFSGLIFQQADAIW